MWGANYILRVYRESTDEQVSQVGFWGQFTDDDPEAMEWLAAEAADWSPAHRLELQKEDGGWTQTLKAAAGTLGCGHDFRSRLGLCSDGSWCP